MPRAVHAIAGLGRSQGGPSYTVPRLCTELRTLDWKTDLVAVKNPRDPPPSEDNFHLASQDLAGFPVLGALRLSSEMNRCLHRLAVSADVVHAHGLWLMPNVYAGKVASARKKPLVVSPRGMLSPEALSFSKVKKRLFWSLLQREAYGRAFAWHATSDAEAADLRAFGIRAPIAVIPNGVDIPTADEFTSHGTDASPDSSRKTLLFLSRFHPKKGIANLLQAWIRTAPSHPLWTLRLVGPDENGHAAEMKSLVLRQAIPRVEFAGASYGAAKWAEYRAADAFILPTLNENFGVAVAEALGMGLPAIVSRGAPWRGLIDNNCGWWVEGTPAGLESAMREAFGLSDRARTEMGRRGQIWVQEAFGWRRIAENMSAVYEWSAGWAGMPGFVVLE